MAHHYPTKCIFEETIKKRSQLYDELIELYFDDNNKIIEFNPHQSQIGKINIIEDRIDSFDKTINDIKELCFVTFEKNNIQIVIHDVNV
jgi:hypothetical protein